VSRYSDYDGEEWFPNQSALWQHNAELALKGKRGRKALAELREALLALPSKRLISGALCLVGVADKIQLESTVPGDEWPRWRLQEANQLIEDQGEGVCAVGALLWYRKVKSGVDPETAFAELPLILSANEDEDGLEKTALLAESELGITYHLAWQLAYKNDESYDLCTPEERYSKFLFWLDKELGPVAV